MTRGHLARVFAACLAAAMVSSVSAAEATTKPAASTQPTVSAATATQPAAGNVVLRVTGPLAAKEMMDLLVMEFSLASFDVEAATPGAIELDYARNDSARGAAGALLAGRDFILTLGPVSDADLAAAKDRWAALAAVEHVVAARAVAIVVHTQNPVESLTMDQLAALFSGKAKDWAAVGGPAKAVRRYGLAFSHPQTNLFHAKVLPSAGCGPITRRAASAEVLSAVADDPQAVGFVDAASALAAGGSVKIVAIELPSAPAAADDATTVVLVWPAVRTIKDGTYPLATTLVLYMSPQASSQSQEFMKFLQAGKGDAILQRHHFLPTLRTESTAASAASGRVTKTKIPPPPPSPSPSTKTPPTPVPNPGRDITRFGHRSGELTDKKLAEIVAANPNLTAITLADIGPVGQLTSLRPLERLRNLERLELHQAGNIKDLTPLARLPNLKTLVILNMEADDLSPLAKLPNLVELDLSFAKNVTDLKPLSRLVNLGILHMNSCEKMADLTPLSRLPKLWNLSLAGCSGVRDFSPLDKLPKLTHLVASSNPHLTVRMVETMTNLRELHIRSCAGISAAEAKQLADRLKKCTVFHD